VRKFLICIVLVCDKSSPLSQEQEVQEEEVEEAGIEAEYLEHKGLDAQEDVEDQAR